MDCPSLCIFASRSDIVRLRAQKLREEHREMVFHFLHNPKHCFVNRCGVLIVKSLALGEVMMISYDLNVVSSCAVIYDVGPCFISNAVIRNSAPNHCNVTNVPIVSEKEKENELRQKVQRCSLSIPEQRDILLNKVRSLNNAMFWTRRIIGV